MDEDDPGSALWMSGKLTKATNPISSKPDPARPDLTRPIRAGYLLGDPIEERYKVLSEDMKKLFEKLEIELEGRQFDSVSDALGWNAYLSKTLKTPDLIDLFTKRMFFNRPKARGHRGDIRTIDLEDFRDKLTAANWRLKNEEYDRLFRLMWNIGMDQPTQFLLKQLNGNFLTLRYHTDHATKDMIVAPFGRSLCFLAYLRNERVTENTGRILFCPYPVSKAPYFPWTVSEYALVLEILRDGVTGGFYNVNNVTEAEDDIIKSKPILCGKGPFTVGKVKAPLGLGLLGSRPRHSLRYLQFRGLVRASGHSDEFYPDEELELDILSTSKPEIVMTGIRESRIGKGIRKEIVGQYDQE
ncbi:MAG: hypothetical protein Q9181_008153 [Wetmoreana brouardii]